MKEPLSWTAPPALPETHYLDNRIYTDPDLFDAEMKAIFGARWKLICHASELAEPGDFRTVTLAGHNLFLVRGFDGEIRTFFNVCPHRGAALIRQPAGNLGQDRIQCFYHLWSFASDGRCQKIPRRDGYNRCGLKEEHVGLRAVKTEIRLGFVWVCLDDDVEPIDEFLEPILADFDPVLTSEAVEVFHIHRAEFKANWKLFVETNCEGYHELLHVLNRTTGLGQKNYTKRRWRPSKWGHNVFEPFAIGYERLELDSRDANLFPTMAPNGHIVADVFPDAMLNIRATVGRIDTLIPVAPGLTILECRGIGLKSDTAETRASRIRQHNQVWGPAGRNLPEDLWAVETQWANMAAGSLPYSIIAREEDNQAMDDSPLRNFYAEWSRLTRRCSHDIDADWRPAPAADRDPGKVAAAR
mgnify:CR=1 FL=1